MSESWFNAPSAGSTPTQPRSTGLRATWARLRAWVATDAGVRVILALILIAGAYMRLNHVNWDMGTHIHPDERFLTMVEAALQLPNSLSEFFDSTRSSMNPYNYDQFPLFVYGTLPIFIVRVAAEIGNHINQAVHLWTTGPDIAIVLTGYDGVHLVGRVLSGLADLACVWLTFVIARRLYSRRVGLVAAALYAFAALPLQQSHFFTVDTFANFFSLLTFYYAVRVAQGGEVGRRGGGWPAYVALGGSLGATIACRINLLPLAVIALLAAGIRAWDDWHVVGEGRNGTWLSTLIQATLFRLLLMGLVTIAVFRIAQPYAFGGTKITDFSFSQHWLDNMRWAQQSSAGDIDMPPGHQWASRTPFVFPLRNMLIWGMGLPMGLVAWAGWALAAWQVIRGLGNPLHAARARAHWLPAAWIGGMFLWQGLQYVESMRYLMQIYPLLAIMAAWLLWEVIAWTATIRPGAAIHLRLRLPNQHVAESEAAEQVSTETPPVAQSEPRMLRFARPAAYVLLGIVVAGTVLWGWGFEAIYRRPLSRVTASRWIYQNVPEGSHVANEHWDDALPFSIDGRMSFKPAGAYYGLSSSSDGQLQMYNEDTLEKREQVYSWLDEADYIVLSSNRLYGSIPRLPMRYPMTTLYYQLLFEGKLGFKQALKETSFPTIFGIQFDDSGAEEAFSVYDHPVVYIFQKTSAYNSAEVRRYLDAVDLEDVVQMIPKQVSAAPTALLLSDRDAARQRASGTWSVIFNPDALANKIPVIIWLLVLEVLGLVAFPLAFVALRGQSDRGYGVSKTLGILLLAWLSWIGPSLKIIPYTRGTILAVLLLLVIAGAAVAWFRRGELLAFVRERRSLLLTEEVLFLVLFGLFLLIRFGNPDLWHPARGGEKPMDFAYLNAVIKSTTFPPYDPWFAGGFLNYYYFGFVIVGTLIKLTGIVPWVAYNLVVPTLFALTGLGAFAVSYSLAAGDESTVFPGEVEGRGGLWLGPLLAGLAATMFVALIGNLGEVKLLFDQWATRSTLDIQGGLSGLAGFLRGLDGALAWLTQRQPLDFPNDWWFWNASRVIPDTINEFPFFTFVYADLHAHMIAFPLTLLGLATAVSLARLHEPEKDANGFEFETVPWHIDFPELLSIVLFGLVAGALRATNTWDFPTYLIVALCGLGVLEAQRRSKMDIPEALDGRLAFLLRAGLAVLWRMIILVVVATLAFYPYTRTYATAYAGLQLWDGNKTTIGDYLIVHGFFLVLVTIHLLSEWWAQLQAHVTPRWLPGALPFIVATMVLVLGAGILLHATTWLIALPLFTLAVVLALGRDLPPSRRMGLLLIALAIAITMGVEVLRQRDDIGRMNTVFKFYIQAWVLFGVGTAFGLASWLARSIDWDVVLRRTAWTVALVLFVCVTLYPPLAARAKVRDRFSAEDQPHTLDGMAYMDKAQYFDNNLDMNIAADKAAIEWMLRNVSGSPVILEGNTPGYRWGNRFAIYTGLPAVMGWDWHQKQQRSVVPGTMIDQRLNYVKEIYTTVDLGRTQTLLDRFNVGYVIVGALERAYYSPQGLAKFDQMASQGYFKVSYDRDGVRIYEVVGRGTQLHPDAPTYIGPGVVPTPTPGAASQAAPQ